MLTVLWAVQQRVDQLAPLAGILAVEEVNGLLVGRNPAGQVEGDAAQVLGVVGLGRGRDLASGEDPVDLGVDNSRGRCRVAHRLRWLLWLPRLLGLLLRGVGRRFLD